MQYRYYTLDVFTDTRFGGNPLAVVVGADALSSDTMQSIAREFNYSETTFVLAPADRSNHANVRIFMPTQEVPFAGHPNVGTAHALAAAGTFGELPDGVTTVRFEEAGGLVPVEVTVQQGQVASCELTAPQALEFGEKLPLDGLDRALGIAGTNIRTATHAPQVVSAGLAVGFVEVNDPSVLARLVVAEEGWRNYTDIVDAVHVYARHGDGQVACRMFAPVLGIPEDPATGSAACALGGLLAHFAEPSSGEFTFDIVQGVEMGRPSRLRARAVKEDGTIVSLHVGGTSVLVMEGELHLD